MKNNLNPTWRPFRIPLQSLCGGDMDKPVKVSNHFCCKLVPACTYLWTDRCRRDASNCFLCQPLLCFLRFNVAVTKCFGADSGLRCWLRRVLLWFLDDACFLISEAVVSGRRVYPSVQVSFSLRCFSCSFMGEVCEWNKWRNRRGEPALQLLPAGAPQQNHICLSSLCSSWSHFTLHLSGLFVVERLVWISHAWFCFCCCLHL